MDEERWFQVSEIPLSFILLGMSKGINHSIIIIIIIYKKYTVIPRK